MATPELVNDEETRTAAGRRQLSLSRPLAWLIEAWWHVKAGELLFTTYPDEDHMGADLQQFAAELVARLHAISDELVAARLAAESTTTPLTQEQAGPLFAALHAVNRNNLVLQRQCRADSQDARIAMDAAHLRLQNLKFEQNHLEREIQTCEEFESNYKEVPLEDIADLALDQVPEDSHELMLLRLNRELAERRRLDAEKKDLNASKAVLVKENEAKKRKLEGLEAQLEAFVTSATNIQTGMRAVES